MRVLLLTLLVAVPVASMIAQVFLPARRISPVLLVSGESPCLTDELETNNLIACWNMDEATGTGNRDDTVAPEAPLGSGGASITAVSGIISNAIQINSSSSLVVTNADHAKMNCVGGNSYTWSAWVFLYTNDTQVVYTKGIYTDSGATYSYGLRVLSAKWRIEGRSFTGVSSAADVVTNQWNFVCQWFDNTANTLNLQVNNGAIASVAFSSEVGTNTHNFVVGNRSDGASFLKGRVDSLMFWKTVLTAAQRTNLYNAALGRTCCD